MPDAEPSKPTASTLLDVAKRQGVCVAFIYKQAQRQREYDAAIAAGEPVSGSRPIAPRIVKMGRLSKITDIDEREWLDQLRAAADANPGPKGKGGRPRKSGGAR
jgi:hypothetical protein